MFHSHGHTRSTASAYLVTLAAASLALHWGLAQAADAPKAGPGDYPSRPIELIIPFAPGGGVDMFGRTVSHLMREQKLVSQPIQVMNRPGAGGSVGMGLMVQKKGDAHTLLGTGIHPVVTPLMLGTPHSYRNMTPIARVYSEYNILAVRTESPIKSLKDIEQALRKDAGSLSFGGASLGTPDHIVTALFARAVGADPTKINYIPYSGANSDAAALGGHVDVALGGLDMIQHVEGGRMRVLAISSPKRLSGRFQNIPTFSEQGYDVVVENWRALFGPPDMPPSAVQFWRQALAKVVASPAWKEELTKHQWVDSFQVDGLEALFERENQMYSTLLKQLGLIKKVQ